MIKFKKYFYNRSNLYIGSILFIICFFCLYTDNKLGVSIGDKKVRAQNFYFITESGSSTDKNVHETSRSNSTNTNFSSEDISNVLNFSSNIAAIDIAEKSFSTFKQFKLEIVELFSKATSRIYVSTDFFGDGDLASSLFIAKFRKIDIMVLINPSFSYKAFSRVGFFQDNGIEVYSRDKNFHTKYKTIILVDNTLYGISTELYDSKNNQEISLTSFNKTNLSPVIEEFNSSKNRSINSKTRLKRPSLPNVKTSTNNKSFSPSVPFNSNNYSDIYNYDKYPQQRQAPAGVSSTLPKELKSKK